jgi:hypothetical protein
MGIGEVLENIAGDYIRVFFVGVGEKKLSLKGLELEQLTGGSNVPDVEP